MFHDCPEFVGGAGAGIEQGLVEFLPVLAGEMRKRLGEQVVFAFEVQVNNALREPGFLGYITQRSAAHALASNALHRCVDKLLTPCFTRCGAGRCRGGSS